MAKTQKYADELLTEAVVRYADVYHGRIKATELAEWASKNIAGLEGVRDYHFLRPVKERNSKTLKIVERTKLCTVRIEEINAGRRVATELSRNVLLNSTNVDSFLNLPVNEQRQAILDTRAQVSKLRTENNKLHRENESLSTKYRVLSEQAEKLDAKIKELNQKQEKLRVAVNRAMMAYDDEERRKVLASIGISDDTLDLDTYVDSLSIGLSEAFSINAAIKGHRITNINQKKETLMEGIEFDCDCE